jgi:DNA polymerase-4
VGVGERTQEILIRLGIRTVGDVAHMPESTLQRALGTALGAQLAALAWGRDERSVVADEPDKSVGAEETFPTDLDDPAAVRRELLRLSERVAVRLRSARLQGRTVSIKIRFADFHTITRSRTLADPTDVAREIYATAGGLYDALELGGVPLRLVGVRLESLLRADAPRQLLLDERPQGWREAEQAADEAARRFGGRVVRPASLFDHETDRKE